MSTWEIPSREIRTRASRELRARGYPVIFPLAFTAGLVSEEDGSWMGDKNQEQSINISEGFSPINGIIFGLLFSLPFWIALLAVLKFCE